MKKLILYIAILSLWSGTASAYNDSIPLINQEVEQIFVRAFYPMEKVYLHMDNTSYFTGDTLWFKAYVINATDNKPTKESEILHVELLNPEGVIVRTQKYRLEGGKCDGALKIDRELLSGFFEIRAYTKAMLNFDDRNYFTRVFPVFEGAQQSPEILDRLRTVGYLAENPSKKELKQAVKESKNTEQYSVEFYPEGGNLVVGLKSRVAFQIRDNVGRSIATECKIIGDNDGVIDSRSTHLGIGVFEIVPKGKGSYMLIGDDKTKYELPKALSNGSVLSVESVASGIEIAVSSNMSEALGLAIMSQGAILIEKGCKSGDKFTIDKQTLREGVNQAVLYNSQGREVASRLFFVRNGQQPQLTITPSKAGESTPHARQDITFKVTDNHGRGVATDFSLAIYEDATAEGTPQQSIYTSLLLSSELRGYIPNADYYFEAEGAEDSERTKNLDLVMMVHGWSSYKWDEVCGHIAMERIFPYEKNISIYGRVLRQKWNELVYMKPSSNDSDGVASRSNSAIRHYPTTKMIPYDDNDSFVNEYIAIIDVNNPDSIFEEYSSYQKDNRFGAIYADFNDKLNLLMRIKPGPLYDANLFILDSEYRPNERLYDLAEKVLSRTIVLKEMSDFPPISIKYWYDGRFSELYKNIYRDLDIKVKIYETVTNRTYTSLERFNEFYLNKKIIAKIDFRTTYQELINNTFNLSGKQFYFRKMPYGTASYLSTMIDVRTPEDSLKGYVTTPLEGEYPDVKWRTKAPFVMYLNARKYEYVIDSTVIYTSLDKRMELYDRYKDHENYTTISINSWLFLPELTFSKKCPDYMIEHFGRIIDTVDHSQPSMRYKGFNITATYSDQYVPIHYVFALQGVEGSKREFYSPDYSSTTPPTDGSDHRRTLYWNPNVVSDAEGNATITFYHNSQGGSYTIDAQTITANGEMGTITK